MEYLQAGDIGGRNDGGRRFDFYICLYAGCRSPVTPRSERATAGQSRE
jgi:hypothetical protein